MEEAMSEISWVKLSVEMFDDRKIKQIRKLPSGNEICLLWIELITLAGKTNDNGCIYLAEDIPYNEEMLATETGHDLQIVKLALATFKKLHMLDILDNDRIALVNWSKHQNIEGMERVRMLTRERTRRTRERQKLLGVDTTGSVTRSATVADGNAAELELEKDVKRIVEPSPRRLASPENVQKVIDYLNVKTGRKFNAKTKATVRLVYARINEGHHFADFQRVVDAKVKQWAGDPKMADYLRPETLFGTKFDSYLATTEPLKVKVDKPQRQFDLEEYERSGKLVKKA
jgi:predicted phage replisome organizer/uncharacterized phage protein (TIGR02220 family)